LGTSTAAYCAFERPIVFIFVFSDSGGVSFRCQLECGSGAPRIPRKSDPVICSGDEGIRDTRLL
jgi:hypothetical protein